MEVSIGKRRKEDPDFSYAVDEHYYVSPQWLYDHVAMYDDYPRDVAVFAGEYAAHTEGAGKFHGERSGGSGIADRH